MLKCPWARHTASDVLIIVSVCATCRKRTLKAKKNGIDKEVKYGCACEWVYLICNVEDYKWSVRLRNCCMNAVHLPSSPQVSCITDS